MVGRFGYVSRLELFNNPGDLDFYGSGCGIIVNEDVVYALSGFPGRHGIIGGRKNGPILLQIAQYGRIRRAVHITAEKYGLVRVLVMIFNPLADGFDLL